MKKFLTVLTVRTALVLAISWLGTSCGSTDKKKEDPVVQPTKIDSIVPPPPTPPKDTIITPDTIATTATVDVEKEIVVAPITKASPGVPAVNGPAVYLHSQKKPNGSFIFLMKANEWGVISINGKIEKLTFVRGNEDGATYSNSNYKLTYDLSYLNSPQVENATAEATVTIKGIGYKTYKTKIWGEWGTD